MVNSIKVKINENFTGNGNAGFVSWKRLEYILRACCEIHDNEFINGYHADNNGITFYIDKKNV